MSSWIELEIELYECVWKKNTDQILGIEIKKWDFSGLWKTVAT